jgi:hypothetical protein
VARAAQEFERAEAAARALRRGGVGCGQIRERVAVGAPDTQQCLHAAGVDPITYLVEVATRTKRNPGAILLPADFKAAA